MPTGTAAPAPAMKVYFGDPSGLVLPPEELGRPSRRRGGGWELSGAGELGSKLSLTASSEEELLVELSETSEVKSGTADDARKNGAFETGEAACCACISEDVPAIRKVNAAARHAIPKRLRLVCIFL